MGIAASLILFLIVVDNAGEGGAASCLQRHALHSQHRQRYDCGEYKATTFIHTSLLHHSLKETRRLLFEDTGKQHKHPYTLRHSCAGKNLNTQSLPFESGKSQRSTNRTKNAGGKRCSLPSGFLRLQWCCQGYNKRQ